MNNNDREQIIRSAISSEKKAGIELSSQSWGIQYSNTKDKWEIRKGTPSCCPLACIVLANQSTVKFQIDWRSWIVETILECDHNWMMSFTNGWDNLPNAHSDTEAYNLGKSLRDELFHPTQLSLEI